ncbi:hypothetical protein AGMMS50239_03700 [Bacteroidia bacterium]|nr:hypothetical protein AGMMS50239_03700 [Bacteroidia bacterium]
MLRKDLLKFALIIPAMAGLCVMASTPDFSVKSKNKTPVVVVAAEEGKVEVDKTVHDFGTIKKEGGSVSAVFTVKNNTKAPIILSEVRASCGCTTPDWTKGPIEAGKTGTVTATYNPSGTGPFEKTVTINVSEGEKTETFIVKIKGTIE